MPRTYSLSPPHRPVWKWHLRPCVYRRTLTGNRHGFQCPFQKAVSVKKAEWAFCVKLPTPSLSSHRYACVREV